MSYSSCKERVKCSLSSLQLQTAASVCGELLPEPTLLASVDSAPDVVVTCADEARADEDDVDEVVRRRGKKRRGKKSGKDGLPEKEVHGFPEPGETQVSAIGDESHNPSVRPSLTLPAGGLGLGAGLLGLQGPGGAAAAAAAAESARLRALERSFLDAESLTHLQRDLDLETVECEFDEKVVCSSSLLDGAAVRFHARCLLSHTFSLILEARRSGGGLPLAAASRQAQGPAAHEP